MARNYDETNFRDLYHQFLLVKDIDIKTRLVIEKAGFHIRDDDNAMLLFGYIDHEVGISFELLCAACVYEDDEVSFEPTNKNVSFKFRYGSFQGDMIAFKNHEQLLPYQERVQRIIDGYSVSETVMEIRNIEELDPSRAPGYPDDIVVFFIIDGYQNEGIWCRVEDIDYERNLIKMRMLNEPNAPFGKHIRDIVDVTLIRMDDGELKAMAVL